MKETGEKVLEENAEDQGEWEQEEEEEEDEEKGEEEYEDEDGERAEGEGYIESRSRRAAWKARASSSIESVLNPRPGNGRERRNAYSYRGLS